MRSDKNGFTLIELIIVIVIIGILSSISAPMMSNMKKKAIASEAITALGAIRTSIQAYRAEHNKYPDSLADLRLDVTRPASSALDGTYFSQECYSIVTAYVAYMIFCEPKKSNSDYAPNAGVVQTWQGTQTDPFISMDESGIFYSNIVELGYYNPKPEDPLPPE